MKCMDVAKSLTHQERETHLSWNNNGEGILLLPHQYMNIQSLGKINGNDHNIKRGKALGFV
jgi:hypothetical protein